MKFESGKAVPVYPKAGQGIDVAKASGVLVPQVVYGYFPAGRDGDAVVVFDPADRTKEIGRFEFPRQEDREELCLADRTPPRSR